MNNDSKKINSSFKTMDKNIKEFIANEKKRNEKIKSMMSNTDYIEWLIQFSKDKEGFLDNDWLYFPERINNTDRENVQNLSLFYEGIDRYSKENYIYPTPCDFGNIYRVKLNNFNFEIGCLNGQGSVYFFNKTSQETNEDFIDFNDIIIEKKQDNVNRINTILDSLSSMIMSAYENEVPIQAIANKLNNTINNIYLIKEDKPKTLLKK